MKVLFLDSEDVFPLPGPETFDLIVDLGRAPAATYEDWSRRAGCRVVSLYHFLERAADLCRMHALLQLGMGEVVDKYGIDWWDISSVLIIDNLLRMQQLGKLLVELGTGCEFYESRPTFCGSILRSRSLGTVHTLGGSLQSAVHRVRHYREALSNLNRAQLTQVLQDKFDPEHTLRARLARQGKKSAEPVTLLPSAYVNVSRMEVAFAAMLPEEKFLLVCSRKIGELRTLPANVRMTSLDPYFVSAAPGEKASLLKAWDTLKSKLVSAAREFADADASGAMERIPVLIRSGVAVRDAWNQVLDCENVTGCLSADDTAPDTRIPLILARNRGLAAVACHHGALDLGMAYKKLHADFYLVKGEMERDYLLRTCGVPPQKLVMGGPPAPEASAPSTRSSAAPWLVFFTEPYQVAGWRAKEVYRDLLPHLISLAKTCGLQLVFKLHPFESTRSIRRLLRKLLPAAEERKILVISGVISSELWAKTKFAVTVQSTVAISCCERGIPVFLCAWLGGLYGGYIEQFARFGVGHVLETAEQISDIPQLMQGIKASCESPHCQNMDSATLHSLLHGVYCPSPEAVPERSR